MTPLEQEIQDIIDAVLMEVDGHEGVVATLNEREQLRNYGFSNTFRTLPHRS